MQPGTVGLGGGGGTTTSKNPTIFVSLLLQSKWFPLTDIPAVFRTPVLLESTVNCRLYTEYDDMHQRRFEVRRKVHDQRLEEALEKELILPG